VPERNQRKRLTSKGSRDSSFRPERTVFVRGEKRKSLLRRRRMGCCRFLVGAIGMADIGGLRYPAGGRVALDCNDSDG
jgi:hypothetical protein